MTKNYDLFKSVADTLNSSYNHFIATSSEEHHESVKSIVINRLFGVKYCAKVILSEKEADKLFEYVNSFDIYKEVSE